MKLDNYSKQKEEEVKAFWKKGNIAAKARKLNAGKKTFYLMDGPPYASGHIHMGTALNKILKDLSIRMKRMQGFDCLDQPGYDTHGLPIEHKVQNELGLKTKEDIEKFGIDKFIKECRNFATKFISVMDNEFDNLGVWMDWENPYITCTNEYIEALWWTFKIADEKGLLYLGKYPIHACPSCETAVAYNEIEYIKQTDTAIYFKFELADEPNTFMIIWTTTPWTLPGNTGVMVHPKFTYAKIALSNGEKWILAKERVQELMNAIEAGYTIEKEFQGKELDGKKYKDPLEKELKKPKHPKLHTVILSERYVNLEEGTGLVHTAPGHGKEDFDAGTKAGLPVLSPVDLSGTLLEEAGKYAGKKARIVDSEIIEDLKKHNALVYQHPYTHDYPVCWRCKSPLLMISSNQWFFRITRIRERLKELNKEVNWVPSWGFDRFNNWLEQLGDWPVSRARYWGTPLPIWLCDCGEKKVVGSIAELKSLAKIPNEFDLHKPWIDEITIKCRCGKQMHRVPEVLDVWFDSGASSWGSLGYPADGKLFKKFWPSDFNLEGKDQIRGWWNSQLITSTICFDKAPFKNIFMHGMVLDLGKKKMSKSQGNIVTPQEVIEKFNRDALRFYIAREVQGEDIAFSWDSFEEINRFFSILWNSINYSAMYLDMEFNDEAKFDLNSLPVEDKWILSRINSLEKQCIESYNKFNYNKVVQLIEEFVLEDLSRTYIKAVRERAGNEKEKHLSKVFSHVIYSLLKLMAPITVHFSEYFFLQLKDKSKNKTESIHLMQFNPVNEKFIDSELEQQFAKAKDVLQTTLNLREELKLRLRWPLNELVIVSETGKEFSKAMPFIQKMANVKKAREETTKNASKLKFPSKELNEKTKVFLDSSADAKLKDEWELMELRRRIQDLRKKANLTPEQKVELELNCSDKKFIESFRRQIESETNTKIISGKGVMEKLIEREVFIKIKGK